MSVPETNKIFILGCERSGSTWLANILDSSRKVITYYEPLAEELKLFPFIPPRYYSVDEVDVEQKNRIEKVFRDLINHKYPFLYQPGRLDFLRYFDQKISYRIASEVKLLVFQNLNLNTTKTVFRKTSIRHIEFEVIKELRLNFKLAVIDSLYNDSKILVSIRNPLFQIQSILKWFEKGRLIELSRNLDRSIEEIITSLTFARYKKLFQVFDKTDLISKVALYWIVNYEELLRGLKNRGLNYLIVRNEDLITEGMEELEKIIMFIGLEDHQSCFDYFENSSKSKRKSIDNPLDTNRDSLEYLKKNQNSTNPEIANILSKFSECQKLECLNLYEAVH